MSGPFVASHRDDDEEFAFVHEDGGLVITIQYIGEDPPAHLYAAALVGALNAAPAEQPLDVTLKNLAERGHA